MSIVELIILALIQGLTEFLPISSSAHLILTPKLLGWPQEQGVLIDVMAHFGSLFAVLLYFRSDVVDIIFGLKDLLARKLNQNSALALNLIIATPPTLIAGFILHSLGWDEIMRSVALIAATSIIFGLLLWWADIRFSEKKTTEDMSWKDAVKMGLAQTIALIPGTSRSGITMTAGRALNMTRIEAARFSMLMSVPIIGTGGLYALYELSKLPTNSAHNLTGGLVVAGLSFISAYIAISFFMKLVARIGMFPFMVYRVLLGIALFIWYFQYGS